MTEENMKKTLLAISISSLLCSSLSFAEQGNALNINKKFKADENIVVTANRSIQDKFDTLAAVDIFTRENIELIQPLSIGDLLGRVAGISIANQGTAAHQSSAYIRGTNSDHVLVLVNGVRVGSATLGVKSIADIPVQLVERLEVIRGPRAALWGSDAVGGVIQIFTRDLAAGEGQAGIKVASNSLYQGYGALGLGNEVHSYTLSASAEKSDGFDVIVPDGSSPFTVDQNDDDGYDRQSIGLSGTSEFTEQYSLELNSQYDQGTTEIDTNTLFSGDETSYENYHLLLRNHIQLEQLYMQLGLSTSQDNTEDNYSQYGEFANSVFTTSRDQVTALAQLPVSNTSELTTGFEWYTESIDSNNVYDETDRDASAFFITGRHDIEQVKLEASIRYDKVGDITGETTYQFAAGYQLDKQLLFSLSHGTAFKAPSFNDLYYPFSGNPDLISETADSSEFLTRYQDDHFSAEISVYQTNIDNLIEWAPTDSSDPFSVWKPANIAKSKMLGVEATLSAELFETSNSLTLSHVDAEDKSTGRQLARRPNFSANYNLVYSLGELDFTFDVSYQGSRYDNAGATEKTLKAYTLVDLGANYRLSNNVTVLAKVSNLADKDYQTASEYPGAERGYSLTFDYKF
jgi:vitamin B12 transporter